MAATTETIQQVEQATGSYKYGFVTNIETDKAPKGLSEDIVRFISAKKDEPEWMLEWRLKAFRRWQTMTAPDWAKLDIPPIDYQDIYYYSAPKQAEKLKSLDEVDPELLATYEKAGHSAERAEDAGKCRRRCRVRLGVGRHDLSRGAV